MGTILTNEQYLLKLNHEYNGNIIPLENYVGSKYKMLHHCNKHNVDFYFIPKNIKNVRGCPVCAKEHKSYTLKINSPSRKTHSEFLLELKSTNNNIEILSEYINAQTNVLCKCKIDGHEWSATPANLLRGTGCPRCSGRYMTDEIFKIKLKEINTLVEVLESYIDSKTKLKCRCKIDGNLWYAKPNNLLSGKGCPKCGNVYRRTHKEFTNELYNINPNILVLSKFKIVESKIKCRCRICDSEWHGTPRHLLDGVGCPYCCQSKGEKRIQKYLDLHNILYDCQYKYDDLIGLGGGLLSYDFYLHNYNLLIEYQGIQHKEPTNFYGYNDESMTQMNFMKQQKHDNLKRQFAIDNNIKLLEIWYWDYNSIEEILNKELLSHCDNSVVFSM